MHDVEIELAAELSRGTPPDRNHMNDNEAIKVGAKLARGDYLVRLFRLCEEQRTTRTPRLESLLHEIAAEMGADAWELGEWERRREDDGK